MEVATRAALTTAPMVSGPVRLAAASPAAATNPDIGIPWKNQRHKPDFQKAFVIGLHPDSMPGKGEALPAVASSSGGYDASKVKKKESARQRRERKGREQGEKRKADPARPPPPAAASASASADPPPPAAAEAATAKKAKKEKKVKKEKKKGKKAKKAEKRGREETAAATTKKSKPASADASSSSADDGGSNSGGLPKGCAALGGFPICEATVRNLREMGVAHLFPIQAMTFNEIYAGRDMIGRARTGMGKTLAFALPIVERLMLAGGAGAASTQWGRAPKVLVMAPTRELAKQVYEEFEKVAPSLKMVCIYGGAPYDPQCEALREGVDVVVGTPGRIIDHLDRQTLRLGTNSSVSIVF